MTMRAALERLFDKAEGAGPGVGQTTETARLMSDLLLRMRDIASRSKMRFLAYLLEMAYYEAYSIANKVSLTADDLEQLRQINRQAKAAPTPDGPARKVA
jgi:hypothetical protein